MIVSEHGHHFQVKSSDFKFGIDHQSRGRTVERRLSVSSQATLLLYAISTSFTLQVLSHLHLSNQTSLSRRFDSERLDPQRKRASNVERTCAIHPSSSRPHPDQTTLFPKSSPLWKILSRRVLSSLTCSSSPLCTSSASLPF